MSDTPVLSLRALNRAALARQMLLERVSLGARDAVARLVGMQAQMPAAPYIGLWTRLIDFERHQLADAIARRELVKATFLRATLHLVAGDDYRRLRGAVRPALEAAADSIVRRSPGFDRTPVLAAAREFLAERPRTFAEISALLEGRWPEHDVGAMRYTVRTHIPLVQVPADTRWSFPGSPSFALADAWLGTAITDDGDTPALIRRYLAAFGPARVADIQTWSGLAGLKPVVDAMLPDLRALHDERGRLLVDLQDAPLPDPDTPAPPRFLPPFDNLLLSYDERARFVPDAFRKRVFLPGLRVAGTILVDGFVAGAWTWDRRRANSLLTVEPFVQLASPDRDALAEEGEALLRFLEPDARAWDVRFEGPA